MPRMSQAEYEAYLARAWSGGAKCKEGEAVESRLHAQIQAECKRRGWISLHGSMAHETRRTIGEPDFVILAAGGKTLLVECKSKTGKLTTEQGALIAWAGHLGHQVHIVRSLADFLALL